MPRGIDVGTRDVLIEEAKLRHPSSRVPVALGDSAVELIGEGLLQHYYGAPYDHSGTFREEAMALPEVIDIRESAAALSPREVKARWRAFRTYWFGQLLSVIGDHFTIIALPLAADRVTHSAFVVGMVVFAETLSTVLFGTAAGVFADRRSPVSTMVVTDLSRAAVLALLLVAELTGRLEGWMIVLLSFVLGAMRLLHDGGEAVFVAEVIPDALDVRSQARITLSENIGSTIGPIAAGGAASIGLWLAFGVDGLSFLLAVLALAAAVRVVHRRHVHLAAPLNRRSPDPDLPSYVDDLRATFTLIRGESVYARTLVIASIFNLLTLPVGAQFIPLARHTLHLSPVWIGAMFALTGVAGMAAAPVVERGRSIRPGHVVWSTGLVGAAVLVAGLLPNLLSVSIAFAVTGVGFAIAFTHYAALRQRLFPANVQGRVALASRTIMWSTVLVGSVATGWLSEVTDPAAMWILCGAAGIGGGVLGSALGLLRPSYD